MSYRYPILLDVSAWLAVVVGGGRVGARKAAGLIDAGVGRVRVVSPEFCAEMPAGVERVTGRYEVTHLNGARLAFAATDSAVVNEAVVTDARRLGILVNRADVDEGQGAGDFTVPAQLRQSALLVTVSAAGSPAVAASVRDEIRAKLDPRWDALAGAFRSLRPRIRSATSLDPARRRSLLKELASPAVLDLAGGGESALWQWARDRYPELESA